MRRLTQAFIMAMTLIGCAGQQASVRSAEDVASETPETEGAHDYLEDCPPAAPAKQEPEQEQQAVAQPSTVSKAQITPPNLVSVTRTVTVVGSAEEVTAEMLENAGTVTRVQSDTPVSDTDPDRLRRNEDYKRRKRLDPTGDF
ncbi:MAG: hypothetical protein OXT65_05680 [Alphaproteobacteria bacterium]|nr:hypothetical protein [Alphaproteobacteria bacterium]